MNTKLVNAAAVVLAAAMEQGKTIPATLAIALDSAQLLQSPETAAELEQLRGRAAELEAEEYVAPSPSCTRCYGADAARFVAEGGATSTCRVCGPSEVAELRARVAELEAERHTTNEALSDAAETLRANRDRIAALERRIKAEECCCPEPAPLCDGCRCRCHADEQRPVDEDLRAEPDVTPQVQRLRALLAGQREQVQAGGAQ
ncbi:hypothetical protein ACIOC2_01255 [Streptomyces sp. NPDC088337]|uniref:hypothetical protein n=1 Tax=unclassified Streptomyces TaxID=2593676 RepID=UPI0037FEF139